MVKQHWTSQLHYSVLCYSEG